MHQKKKPSGNWGEKGGKGEKIGGRGGGGEDQENIRGKSARKREGIRNPAEPWRE